MALNIKDNETDRLARELAKLTGQPITTAVRDAIAARIASLRRQRQAATGLDLADIIARGRARRTLDNRPENDILGYAADGIPA